MKTTPVTFEDLQSSVIAVPPLCRAKDLSLSKSQNSRLIKHMYKGGIRTLLYGGNANLYNIAVSEYHSLLKMLVDISPEDMWIVPSVGPMYGTAMDQAKILSEFAFPTAMLLPTLFPSKPAGVATAIRHFVEKSGLKAVLYIKDGSYITPELAAELVNDGLISWIKYAIVEEDPSKDAYLKKLIKLVDTKLIVSGIGERARDFLAQELAEAALQPVDRDLQCVGVHSAPFGECGLVAVGGVPGEPGFDLLEERRPSFGHAFLTQGFEGVGEHGERPLAVKGGVG